MPLTGSSWVTDVITIETLGASGSATVRSLWFGGHRVVTLGVRSQLGGPPIQSFVAVAVRPPSVAVIVFVPTCGGVFENVNVAFPPPSVVPDPVDGTAAGPPETVNWTVSPTYAPRTSK